MYTAVIMRASNTIATRRKRVRGHCNMSTNQDRTYYYDNNDVDNHSSNINNNSSSSSSSSCCSSKNNRNDCCCYDDNYDDFYHCDSDKSSNSNRNTALQDVSCNSSSGSSNSSSNNNRSRIRRGIYHHPNGRYHRNKAFVCNSGSTDNGFVFVRGRIPYYCNLFLALWVINIVVYDGTVQQHQVHYAHAFPSYLTSGVGCYTALDPEEVIMNANVLSYEEQMEQAQQVQQQQQQQQRVQQQQEEEGHNQEEQEQPERVVLPPQMQIVVDGHVPKQTQQSGILQLSFFPVTLTLQVLPIMTSLSSPEQMELIQDYQYVLDIVPPSNPHMSFPDAYFVGGTCDHRRRIVGRTQDRVTLQIRDAQHSVVRIVGGWASGHEAVKLTPPLEIRPHPWTGLVGHDCDHTTEMISLQTHNRFVEGALKITAIPYHGHTTKQQQAQANDGIEDEDEDHRRQLPMMEDHQHQNIINVQPVDNHAHVVRGGGDGGGGAGASKTGGGGFLSSNTKGIPASSASDAYYTIQLLGNSNIETLVLDCDGQNNCQFLSPGVGTIICDGRRVIMDAVLLGGQNVDFDDDASSWPVVTAILPNLESFVTGMYSIATEPELRRLSPVSLPHSKLRTRGGGGGGLGGPGSLGNPITFSRNVPVLTFGSQQRQVITLTKEKPGQQQQQQDVHNAEQQQQQQQQQQQPHQLRDPNEQRTDHHPSSRTMDQQQQKMHPDARQQEQEAAVAYVEAVEVGGGKAAAAETDDTKEGSNPDVDVPQTADRPHHLHGRNLEDEKVARAIDHDSTNDRAKGSNSFLDTANKSSIGTGYMVFGIALILATIVSVVTIVIVIKDNHRMKQQLAQSACLTKFSGTHLRTD